MQAIGSLGIGTLGLILAAASTAGAVEPKSPDEVSGLVAWYATDGLHERLGDKSAVPTWPDGSGAGHDLTTTTEHPPIFRTSQVAERPAVEVRKGDAYAVTQPFELVDHTIFIVYRQAYTRRGLLCSDLDPNRGIVLGDGPRHVARDGGVGRPSVPYTAALGAQEEGFHLAVLAREGGRMRAFQDGADVSSMARWEAPLRVGKFFQVTYSKQVDQDGAGLELAEMAFYDRFLSEDDRRAVTENLAHKFGLTLAEKEGGSLRGRIEAMFAASKTRVARLAAAGETDLGAAEGAQVVWGRQVRVDPPWRHEMDKLPMRLHATADGTAARIYLSLVMETAGPGNVLRVLLLKNSKDWLPGEVNVGPFGGEGAAARATADLVTRTQLAAGDYLEVWIYRSAGEGAVHAVSGESVLFVEAE